MAGSFLSARFTLTFELRQARKNAHQEIETMGDAAKVQYKYRNDDYLKKESKITKKLSELYNRDIDDTDFYYLCFYLENDKSVYKNQVYD